MDNFSTFDIKRLFGVGIDLLKDWRQRGYIVPSIQEAAGQGTKSIYSFGDLCRVVLFRQLINKGLSRDAASFIIKNVSTPYFEKKEFWEKPFYVAVIAKGDSKESIGVVSIFEKNFSNTFEKLFLRFDDPHGERDASELFFEDALVLNMKSIVDFVASKID